MSIIKKCLSKLLLGILAGVAIAIGCISFLCIENVVAGAVSFTVGLFIVLDNGFGLFTGMVCYIPNNPPRYALDVLITIIGNFIGATASGFAIRLTDIANINARAASIVEVKSARPFLAILILAIFCNLLIYFAVDCYKRNPSGLAKYMGTIFCIPVFIVCGYEHCVANMCYIAVANAYTPQTIVALLTVILGNTIGGMAIVCIKNIAKRTGKDG